MSAAKRNAKKMLTSSDLVKGPDGYKLPSGHPSSLPDPKERDPLIVRAPRDAGRLSLWIVMPTVNRPEEFKKCLKLVYQQLEDCDRVLVVASGYEMFDKIRHVACDEKIIGLLLGEASVNEARRTATAMVPEDAIVVEMGDHDYLRPDALAKIRRAFLDDEYVTVVYGNHRWVNQDGGHDAKWAEKPQWRKGAMHKRCWVKGVHAYRKWIFTRYGGWVAGEEPAGDHANAIRWEDAGCKFYCIPGDPLIDITIDPAGISASRRNKQVENSKKFASGDYKKLEPGGGKKLLFLMHNNPFVRPRGGEKSMLSIIRYLMDFGYDCKLTMPIRNGAEDPGTFDVTYFQAKSMVEAWLDIEREISEILESFSPDLMLTWSTPIRLTRSLSIRYGIPYVVFVRSFRFLLAEDNEWYIECLRDAAAVVTNCEYTTDLLKDRYGIDSISSYVPVSVDDRVRPGTGRYLTIIGREKGVEFLGDIAPQLKDQRFLVVDYGIRKEMEDGNILYVPYDPDISHVWKKTDILLFPAAEDMCGTSRTTMEAMLQGIPVIVQDRCGLSELNPITVSDGATAQEWYQMIRQVQQKRLHYSKNARRFAVENHDPNREIDKIRGRVARAIPTRGKVLFTLEEGIGNIVEMIPAVRAVLSLGYEADAVVLPTSSVTHEFIGYQPYFGKTFSEMPEDTSEYRWLLSCHWRSKFQKEDERVVVSKHFKNRPEREWYMEIARRLGYRGATPRAKVFYPRTWFDVDPGTVVFSPDVFSESWKLKRWPYYSELARSFERVVLVGKNEDLLPEGDWPDNVENYVGKLSLFETISLMAQCRMFVGNDGGLAHIAATLDIPTFIIFGPTTSVKNLPAGAIEIGKRPPEECQPCQFTECFLKCEDRKCMDRLEPESVYQQISEGLKKWKNES